MIKSFKDFDDELKGQKIYEAEVIDDVRDENEDVFTEEDVVVPEMISDNKFLLKISRIVLKRLEASGLGEFGVNPTIITIDDVPGVYFYNYDEPSMNIVICRNANGKHAYIFKEFNIGENNVADLVLSTTKLGFSDIIDQLISYLTPNAIEEGLICEWVEGSFNYSEKDVEKVANMPVDVRQTIVNLLKDDSANGVSKKIFNNNTVEPNATIYAAIEGIYGRVNQSNVKKVIDIFDRALNKKTDHDEVFNVLNDCKFGGKTAISSASGVSAMIDDDMEEFNEAYKKRIEQDTKEYESSLDRIYEMAVAMCRYVKQNGDLDDDDLSALPKRAMIITGKGGIGKSESIRRALEDEGMIEDRDYYNMTSGSTAVQALFKKLYDYNGKLLIFDDSGELFNSTYKMNMWKHALDPDVENADIELSRAATGDKSGDSRMYVPAGKTRQERYFLEVGHSSLEEKGKYQKKRFSELERKYREETGDHSSLTASQRNEFNEIIAMEWNKMEEEKEPLMPNKFKYKGVVVIISNDTRDSFKKEVGVGNWGAIVDRMRSFDLHPMAESIWAVIKKILIKQRDAAEETLPSKMCMIPRDIVDEFIEEVERLLEMPQYREMTFRIVAKDMHRVLNGSKGRLHWKEDLAGLMDINK
jgi:hypothetical protein